ncbi:MAG: DUF1415 domain-containing protein [Methylococcaceae bacterium]|jgi:uncharacterized protein
MDNKDQQLIAATQNWLKTIIIDYSICPFAKRELERGSIRFVVSHDTDIESCLSNLMLECDRLNSDAGIETTLIIYDQAFICFDDYLDFVELAEELLLVEDYDGVYQLASFHPDYCFDGVKQDDPANYTNRSPYPMLHLLRETSIDRAVDTYPHTEDIPQRNIELMRELGLAKVQALLAACYSM